MSTPGPQADVNKIWQRVIDKVKVRLVLPSVWRAMEAAHPLVIENDTLILAYPASQTHQGGLLTDSKTNNIIERAVEEETGRVLRLRLIEGETLQDWETSKLRDQEAAALQKAALERRKREQSADQGWDGIMERITRRYAEMPMRQLPQMQALFLEECIAQLAEAARRLLGENATEVDHRSFARVLDRVADRTGIPAAMVAYLVRQKSGE